MPEQQIVPKPEIFVFSQEDTAVVMSAKRLQNAMYRDPDSFVNALTTDNDNAKVRRAGEMIDLLISRKDLLEMYFDDHTESAINKDATHQSLLNQRRQMAQANTNVSRMSESAQERSDRKAEELRERTVKNRCAIFAGRVIAWQTVSGSRPGGDPATARKLRQAV